MKKVGIPFYLLVAASVVLTSCLPISKAQTGVPEVEQTQFMPIPDDLKRDD